MLATIYGIDAQLALLEQEVTVLDEEYKENLVQKERLSEKKKKPDEFEFSQKKSTVKKGKKGKKNWYQDLPQVEVEGNIIQKSIKRPEIK